MGVPHHVGYDRKEPGERTAVTAVRCCIGDARPSERELRHIMRKPRVLARPKWLRLTDLIK